MILADTSVWVDHLRLGNSRLDSVLRNAEVAVHPFVAGELALGHLRRRAEILALLASLPGAPQADHDEVMHFVDRHGLAGSGLGWVDVHLLCAAALSRLGLWTLDRRLAAAAAKLGLAG